MGIIYSHNNEMFIIHAFYLSHLVAAHIPDLPAPLLTHPLTDADSSDLPRLCHYDVTVAALSGVIIEDVLSHLCCLSTARLSLDHCDRVVLDGAKDLHNAYITYKGGSRFNLFRVMCLCCLRTPGLSKDIRCHV